MKSHQVRWYGTRSNYKAAFVEAFNGIFQTLMSKHLIANELGKRWIDSVNAVIYKYNYKRIHGFLDMTPFEAEKPNNREKVLQKFKNKHDNVKQQKIKFKIGDTVRIWLNKGRFARLYHASFSSDTFKISRILTNLPKPRYVLLDYKNEEKPEELLGSFSQDELVLYNGVNNK